MAIKDLNMVNLSADPNNRLVISGVGGERVTFTGLPRSETVYLIDDLLGNEYQKGVSFSDHDFTFQRSATVNFADVELLSLSDTVGDRSSWNNHIGVNYFNANFSNRTSLFSAEGGFFHLNLFYVAGSNPQFLSLSYDHTIGANGELKLSIYSDVGHTTLVSELSGDAGYNFLLRYRYYIGNFNDGNPFPVSGYLENFDIPILITDVDKNTFIPKVLKDVAKAKVTKDTTKDIAKAKVTKDTTKVKTILRKI